MIYKELKQFLDDSRYEDAIRNGLEYPLQVIIRWNDEDPTDISNKINTLIISYIIQELRQYENYYVLWWEDSDDVAVNTMMVSKITTAILTKYSYSFVKIIEGLKYIVDNKNFNLDNVVGSIVKSSRNDGYSNFVNDSLEDQNNWSNTISSQDSRTISDMITLQEYFKTSDLHKITNEIRDNVLVLVYGGGDYGY